MQATIVTNASAKEIAGLVLALQDQLDQTVELKLDGEEFAKSALEAIRGIPPEETYEV